MSQEIGISRLSVGDLAEKIGDHFVLYPMRDTLEALGVGHQRVWVSAYPSDGSQQINHYLTLGAGRNALEALGRRQKIIGLA